VRGAAVNIASKRIPAFTVSNSLIIGPGSPGGALAGQPRYRLCAAARALPPGGTVADCGQRVYQDATPGPSGDSLEKPDHDGLFIRAGCSGRRGYRRHPVLG
jgi:hypothetical protein